jgi:glyoxylase-like metal-dependent hydrolase (beta-lactamase superfamily II)
MRLQQLAERTYAVESDFASLGIYLLDKKHCLLIDSGHSAAQAREILRILDEQGWVAHAILNTHSHADHCGGNRWLQDSAGCDIYATPLEAAFIENPVLLPYSTYSAYPPKLLMGKFFMPQPSKVTRKIEEGPLIIKDIIFQVLPLPGHSLGQVGLITPDGILFAGDSLVSEQILGTLPFVFLCDVAGQLSALDNLHTEGYQYLYLSHGGLAEDNTATINLNRNVLMKNIALVEKIITHPHSLESVVSQFTIHQRVTVNRNHYFRLSNTIASILAYLVNQGRAAIVMLENTPHYRTRA